MNSDHLYSFVNFLILFFDPSHSDIAELVKAIGSISAPDFSEKMMNKSIIFVGRE